MNAIHNRLGIYTSNNTPKLKIAELFFAPLFLILNMKGGIKKHLQAKVFSQLQNKVEELYRDSLEKGGEELFFDRIELIFINALKTFEVRRKSKFFGFIFRRLYPDPTSEEALKILENLAQNMLPPTLENLKEDIIPVAREAFNVYKFQTKMAKDKTFAKLIAQNIRKAIENYEPSKN